MSELINTPAETPIELAPDYTSSYNIHQWSEGYAKINEQGHVAILPTRENEKAIDLMELVAEGKRRGLRAPILIRFQDLLRDRVRRLNESFASSIQESGYKNVYRGVFPIKVNQLHEVVEEIVDAGKQYHFGLEAGSKSEMIAALSVHDDPESLIIGNGYKDCELIRAALLGVKLGKKVILVIEKLEELHQILAIGKTMGVMPLVGARVRLLSKGAGKWATSGGENAKFGLDTAELVNMSDILHDAGIPEALKMLHYHVGSQVPDISTINRATCEATRFYAKLYHMGHRLEYLDVGGGLAIDYDGSRTSFDSSANYSVHEYTRALVYNIIEVCDAEKVPHPILVSESGRYIAAPHSVLIVEAFGAIEKDHASASLIAAPTDHKLVSDMLEIRNTLNKKRRQEHLHEAQQIRDQGQSMFELGLLDLRSKAKIDTLYWEIATKVVQLYQGVTFIPEEIKELEISLADQLICNFSVFQSLIDHWALGQLFPIMPIHRLHEKATCSATLVDITCDSDGKIAKFIDFQDIRPTLPLHELKPNDPYYLGFFLTGAYQDIMGDLHNLFGRVHEMHVFLDEDEEDGYYIEEVIPGTTIGSVLTHTQWDTKAMVRRIKTQLDVAIKSDRLKPNEGMRLLSEYERTLASYTYLHFS